MQRKKKIAKDGLSGKNNSLSAVRGNCACAGLAILNPPAD